MTKLLWDEVGERRYETGVDRGVLYVPNGNGVPWNGLTSVDEDLSDIETNAFYFDGIKYLDTRYPGDFSATLKAFTYPDEFLEFDGFTELNNGVLLGHQPVYERFGLSYRTRVGNDIEGTDHGYKIHVLYNLAATPDSRSYASLSDQQNPLEFSWNITGVPELIEGHRPTIHMIFDTTRINPYLVADIESILYGKDPVEVPTEEAVIDGGVPATTEVAETDGGTSVSSGTFAIDGGTVSSSVTTAVVLESVGASLPPLADLVSLINGWVLIDIVDNGDGTWTATGPDEFVSLTDSTTFKIISTNATFIDAETYEIATTSTF